MSRNFALAALALACLATPILPVPSAAAGAQPPRSALSAGERRGLAFAQRRCSGCHAVTANSISPNRESPPFEDIANWPGLTRTTLRAFLRDSHNYPAAMNFRIDQARIRDLADYVLTMSKAGYRPVM
jgi:mono/diheme cytochrome c family protein